MTTTFKCPNCHEELCVPQAQDEHFVLCPACRDRVALPELPPSVPAITLATDGSSPTNSAPRLLSSGVLPKVIGASVVLGISLIAWLGWTTFIIMALWIIVVLAALIAVGCGAAALRTSQWNEKVGGGVGIGLCAVIAVVAWRSIPSTERDSHDTGKVESHDLPATPLSPDDQYVIAVSGAEGHLWAAMSKEKPEDLSNTLERCGLAIRGVPVSGVHPDLSAAALQLADALTAMSRVWDQFGSVKETIKMFADKNHQSGVAGEAIVRFVLGLNPDEPYMRQREAGQEALAWVKTYQEADREWKKAIADFNRVARTYSPSFDAQFRAAEKAPNQPAQ